MAEPTDLRTRAEDALRSVAHNGPFLTGPPHARRLATEFADRLADAVLAADLAALRKQVLTEAASALITEADDEAQRPNRDRSSLLIEGWLREASTIVRRLAATGPSAPHVTPQTPERAEVVPEVTPGPDDAAESDEGYEPFVAAEHYTEGPTYLDLVPRADLDRVTAERDRLAETIQQWEPVIDAARDYIAGCKDPGSPAQVLGFVNLRNAIDALDDTDQTNPGDTQ